MSPLAYRAVQAVYNAQLGSNIAAQSRKKSSLNSVSSAQRVHASNENQCRYCKEQIDKDDMHPEQLLQDGNVVSLGFSPAVPPN